MSRNRLSIIMLVVLLILTACRWQEPAIPTQVAVAEPPTLAPTFSPRPTNTPTPSPVPATRMPTDPQSTATATVAPPSPTLPTYTPSLVPPTSTATIVPPTATPTRNFGPPPGGSAQIAFAPGATSAVVRSTLVAGGDGDTWLLRVNAGQVIAVQTLSSAPGTINVSLVDPTGSVLASNPDIVGVSAAAPVTGDYQINLATVSGSPEVSYTMQVFVPPAEAGPPTRIIFAEGTSSAQLASTLNAGGDIDQYVIRLAANQGLSVAVFASTPAVTNIYIRDTTGRMISGGTDLSGAFATSTVAGDYFIDVSSAAGAPQISYTLTVSAPPVQPPSQAVRIEFGPGQISAWIDGQIVTGGSPPQYIIHVLAGQTMITNLTDNPLGSTGISIYDENGNLLNFGRGPVSLATTVPATGDYTINLSAETAPVGYSLEVIVPPSPPPVAERIVFPAGTTSATVNGNLAFGGDLNNWVVRALAGQMMNISVATVTPGWMRIFVYNEAGQIIGLGTDISGVSVPLATTGDYRIVVVGDPAIGPVSYSMVVSIP
ncbi:MAG: hypothetical protein R6X18_15980 [Chloroflexota bacterium]